VKMASYDDRMTARLGVFCNTLKDSDQTPLHVTPLLSKQMKHNQTW